MKLVFFISCLFFSVSLIMTAQTSSSAPEGEVYRGLGLLYDFQFKKADSLTASLEKSYPTDVFVQFLSANAYWWKIISGEDSPGNRDSLLKRLSLSETILLNKPKETLSDLELFCLINVYAYRSRLELLDDSRIKALASLDKSISWVERSFQRTENYPPFLLTSGLYNYLMAEERSEHVILRPFLSGFPGSDKAKGLDMLKKAVAANTPLLQTEAGYFLMRIYLESENDVQKALEYARQLVQRHPDNLIYQYYYYQVLVKGGDKAKQTQQQKVVENGCCNPVLNEKQRAHFLGLLKKETN